MFRNIILCWFL